MKRNKALTAEEYAQATEKYCIDHSHLNVAQWWEQIVFDDTTEDIEPDLIDVTASRKWQIENDKSSTNIDIQKVAKYIDNNLKFKNNLDGSLTLPNGTTIASKRKNNTLTKSVCEGKSSIRTWTNFSWTEMETESISFNDLKPIVKERGWLLEEDGYKAILWWEKKRQKLLIDGNFPDNFNPLEKEAWLLYATQQLYWLHHINASSPRVLELDQNQDFRGTYEWGTDNGYGLIWVKNA